ncbi:MAG: hypothetical protein U9Q79_10930, partial [Candidatus Hydrogenedentes bacterium]|nr:hypothetical protein [Candidatus Hydrogenedentota bacterium]
MAKRRQDGLNRREFLSRSGRGAMAGGLLSAASQTSMAVAEAQETKTPERGKSLLVGWSTVTITPDRPVQLHGQFHERVSERVLDQCLATALALEGSGEQAIMVSCDVVNVQREVADEVRKRVSQRLPDFDANKLFLNATHTHTGPTMTRGLYRDPEPPVMGPVEYSEFFTVKVTEAAIEAWNARQSGVVSRAFGHAAVGFCRIAKYADGTARMYGKSDRPDFVGLEGENDHGVEILFTIMGPGCESVQRLQTDGYEFVVGRWNDGRIGTYRGLKSGKKDYGTMVFGSKGIARSGGYEGYGHLVNEIVKFFKTGAIPVPASETIEIFAFMTAADASKEQ